jgi:cell division septation protein DedD
MSNDLKASKYNASEKGFIPWEFMIVLLCIVSVLLYCFVDLNIPFYKVAEISPRPTTSQVPEPEKIKVPSVLLSAPSGHARPEVKTKAKPAAVAVAGTVKPPVPANVSKKTEKPVSKGSAYTLLIGEFPGDSDIGAVSMLLKKHGVSPTRTDQVKRLQPMYRLFLANFDDHETADKEFQTLRQRAPAAFITKENGKFSVFAGSFMNETRAIVEQQRLALEQINLVRQTAQVNVTLTRVTAGTFSDGTAAAMKARQLQKYGVHAKAIKAGA